MKKLLIATFLAAMTPFAMAQTVPNAFGSQALPRIKLGIQPLPNHLPPHIGMVNTVQVPGIATIMPIEIEPKVSPVKKAKLKATVEPEARIKTHEQASDVVAPIAPVKAKLKPEPDISKDAGQSNPGEPYYPTWPATPDTTQVGSQAQQAADAKNNNFGKLFQ